MGVGALNSSGSWRRWERSSPYQLAILAAAGTGIQVGAGVVATRAVVDSIEPVSLTFLRYFIGACCLIPLAVGKTRIRIEHRDLPAIWMIGFIQFGLLIVMLNIGLKSVQAGQGALIFAMSPLLALALGIIVGQERWSGRKVAGIFMALAGLAIATGPELSRASAASPMTGELLILGAAACAAAASVWSRPYVQRYGALPVSTVAMVATVVMLAVPSLVTGLLEHIASMSTSDMYTVIFLGTSSGAGYIMWLFALKTATASTVTTFLMLGPVTALVLGFLILGEPISLTTMVGFAVLGVGVWTTSRSSQKAVVRQT